MAKGKQGKEENDTFLIFLIIILVIIAIILVTFKLITGKSIDPESEEVTKLHDYFSLDDLGNCEGLFNYSDKVVEASKTKVENKLCLAYHKVELESLEEVTYKAKEKDGLCNTDLEMTFRTEDGTKECKVNIYPKEEVEKKYVEMFGSIPSAIESFKTDGFHICYPKDDKYYCGLSDEVTYNVGSGISIYRGIKKANQKGDEIIIYDYFIKMVEEKCYSSYVNGENMTECSNAYQKLKDKKIDYDFMKKYGSLYKHTYKKSKDGTYYWLRSEKI